MKRRAPRRWLCLILGLILGWSPAAVRAGDLVTQVATLEALAAGDYAGRLTLAQVRAYGDLGLGAVDRLDGELILLGGRAYQVTADGAVQRPPGRMTIAYATVVHFRPERTLSLAPATDLDGLKQAVDAAVPNQDVVVAIRVTGRFSALTVRSVPAQTPPFPPLAEVVRRQSVFRHADIAGDLVGFRCPGALAGATVAGYHLHFVDAAKQAGGHVLAFSLKEGRAALDLCRRFQVLLPGDSRSRTPVPTGPPAAGTAAPLE